MRDNVPMMAAATSYYLLVTIVPVALVVSLLVGAVARATAADAPNGGGTLLSRLLEQGGWAAIVVTLGVLVFGASGVFSQFVLAVSRMWDEPPVRGPFYAFVRRHGIAVLLLGVLALALLGSLVVGGILSALVREVVELATGLGIPVPPLDLVLTGRVAVDLIASFLLFTAAFSMVPAHKVRLRDAAPGAAVTAVAYSVGQVALGVYLANSSRVELYGGLGALVAVLLWAYYSALIALYGAELSRLIVLGREGRREAVAGSATPR